MTPDGAGSVADRSGYFAGDKDGLPTANGTADAERTVSLILGRTLLAKATELARQGRYGEAEGLLQGAAVAPEDEGLALDLLARIKAQQGRLRDAEELWRKALDREPANETYMAGLRRLSALNRSSWGLFGPYLKTGSIIAVAIVLAAVIVSLSVRHHGAPSPASVSRVTTGSGQSIPSINSMQGVSVKHQKDQIIATFDSGLFSRNTRLRPKAKALLAKLAKELEPHAGQVLIRVTGVTDTEAMPARSRYTDNGGLAMARALKVVQHMRTVSRLPAEIFVVEGRGEQDSPFPNVSPESRLRNRTVVIGISGRPYGRGDSKERGS